MTISSGQLPKFTILENFKKINQADQKKCFTYRDFKNFDYKSFKQELESTGCSLATDNNDLGFETFFHLFERTLDKHAPKKLGSKKDKNFEMKL